MAYKVVVIGGGSTVFGPSLISSFVASKVLAGSTVVLVDINEERVRLMEQLAHLHAAHANADVIFESTTNRRTVLKGADFVIMAAPIGGFEMRELDIEIPARYGVYTIGGETVGPAAMMRGFRHIPVLLDICREMEKACPNALLFSYTNPTTPILSAIMRKSTIKSVFLCTCSAAPRNQQWLSKLVGVPANRLAVPAIVGGLNHCAGIMKLTFKDGRDALPLALKRTKHPIEKEMLGRYGILPYCTGHWAEFFPRYMRLAEPYKGRLQGLDMGFIRVRDMSHDRERSGVWAEDVQRLLKAGIKGKKVGKMLKGSKKQAELLGKVLIPGERVQTVAIMEAIAENRNEIHGVIVPNNGAIPNLPYNTPIEVSAVVGATGIYPLQVGPLPEPVAMVLRNHVNFYNMIVDASIAGKRQMALDALLADPLTSAILTLSETEKLLDEMLKAEAAYLPQFK